MFQESSHANNVSDLPSNDTENASTRQRQQHESNQWLPLHTLIDNGCDRIKKELETIQASNNTLLLEHNRMAMERAELERKCQASYEKYCMLFVEMSRQREVVNRLESIIDHCTPFLPPEKHSEIVNSIYQAKQFRSEDLKRLAEQQEVVNELVVIPDDVTLPNRNSADQRFSEISNAQTSLTNLVLQLLLLNATNNNSNSDSSPRLNDDLQNQLANFVPANSFTWPANEPKPQAPKRKRPTKRKIQQPTKQPDENLTRQSTSESQRVLSQLGVIGLKQNEPFQSTPKTISQPDIKPTTFVPEGQENNHKKAPSQLNLHQKGILEYCTVKKPYSSL